MTTDCCGRRDHDMKARKVNEFRGKVVTDGQTSLIRVSAFASLVLILMSFVCF